MHLTNDSYVVFYTDDDPDDRDVFKEVMNNVSAGHQLHLQANADELLAALQNPPLPDLVFLDLNMPRKSGFDALREMRASEAHRQTPVILFTTSTDEQNVTTARSLGANMFISKPRSYKQLKQTLEDVLAKDWHHASNTSQHFETRIS